MAPYSGIAQQILNAYQNAANTQGGYAQGFSTLLQDLANSEAESALEILERNNAPESQQAQVEGQAAGPVGDALYGQTGYIPATGLGEQGNAFAAYASTLPGLLNSELAQQAAYFHAVNPPPSASGGSGGGGEAPEGMTGLTPSQQLALAKFEYDQEQDAMKWDFEMAKWDYEMEQDKFDRKKEERSMKLAMQAMGLKVTGQKADINLDKKKFKQEQRESERDYQLDVTQANQAQQRIDNAAIADANRRAAARGEKASAYWNGLGDAGRDIFDDAFPNIGKTTTTPFDPSKPPGTTGGTRKVKPPTYGVAFRRVMSGLRATQTKPGGGWKYGFTNKQMRAKVNQILKSKGIPVPGKRRRRKIRGPVRTSPRPAPGRR